MNTKEIENAKVTGVLDSNGNVPNPDFLDLSPGTGGLVLDSSSGNTLWGATPYVVWGFRPERAASYQDAHGEEIKGMLCQLIRQ